MVVALGLLIEEKPQQTLRPELRALRKSCETLRLALRVLGNPLNTLISLSMVELTLLSDHLKLAILFFLVIVF